MSLGAWGSGFQTAGAAATATGLGAPIGITLGAIGAGFSLFGAKQQHEEEQERIIKLAEDARKAGTQQLRGQQRYSRGRDVLAKDVMSQYRMSTDPSRTGQLGNIYSGITRESAASRAQEAKIKADTERTVLGIEAGQTEFDWLGAGLGTAASLTSTIGAAQSQQRQQEMGETLGDMFKKRTALGEAYIGAQTEALEGWRESMRGGTDLTGFDFTGSTAPVPTFGTGMRFTGGGGQGLGLGAGGFNWFGRGSAPSTGAGVGFRWRG